MPYIKFNELTTEQMAILEDKTKTAKEIQLLLGCGIATISRWRGKINAQPGKGSKPNKPREWQVRRRRMTCMTCNKEVDVALYREKTFKYCSRSCMVQNESYINNLKNVDKSYMQTEKYRAAKRKLDTPEYRRYRNRVSTLTKQTYQKYKDVINPNNYKRTIAGVDEGYHLDHKISCREGFDNNMAPELISDVSNLQMLPWLENVRKGRK